MKSAKVQSQMIPIKELHPFPGNPNEQDSQTFANLVEEISKDGFEEPLAVVPRHVFEAGAPGYVVVSGNHRLDACQKLGFAEIECVVHHDWDAETAKIKVMRRNMMRGKTDPAKFTKLVDSLKGYTHDQLVDAMNFKDIDEFANLYASKSEPKVGKGAGNAHENLVDGLSLILNQLFSDYGDTIPYGFMYFMAGKKYHLSIIASKRTKEILNKLTKECNSRGIDINDAMTLVLDAGIDSIDFDDAQQFQNAAQLPGDDAFAPIEDEE